MTTNSGAVGFSNIIAKLRARAEMLVDDVIEETSLTGEEGINTARQTGNYKDRTGNLRNSIGYEVLHGGKQVASKTTEGQTASTKGNEDGASPEMVASEIKEAFKEKETGADPEKISLVMVAGMTYGKCLETKGYDVINTAVQTAKVNYQSRMNELRTEFVEDVKKIFGK